MNNSVTLQIPFVDLRAQYLTIRDEVQEAIQHVLDAGNFVGGVWVETFEDEFRQFVGAKHAVAVGSGTAALELALKASGIRAGDEVIVPANSFFATAEAVSNIGARPVFADVDPSTSHLDVISVERVFTAKTRAIIPVHLYGRAIDFTELERFAAAHGLAIIEDAAQAHGAERKGVRVGGSGRLCCFSFYPAKNLGAYGDGGAVTGNDADQMETVRLLRDHGSPTKYQHKLIGTNSRLDAMQAAVLSVKLRCLDIWNDKRRKHAIAYATALAGSRVVPPMMPSATSEHNFHLFVVRTQEREGLRQFLQQRGIGTGIHYPVPLHLTTAYQQLGYPGHGALPVSEGMAEQILSLPLYAEMSLDQVEKVIRCTLEFAEQLAMAPRQRSANRPDSYSRVMAD